MPRPLALISLMLVTAMGSSVFLKSTSVATASEVELCFGQVPTIVGAPDQQGLEGTGGPDVATNGAYGVNLLGGDDLLRDVLRTICGLVRSRELGLGRGEQSLTGARSTLVSSRAWRRRCPRVNA